MSIFINEVAVTTFDPLVKQAYQEKGFKLNGTTRMARTPKKTHKFPKVGKSMAKQKAAQDMVVPSNVVWSDADVILQPWYDAEYSGIFGQADINFDEKRELAEVLAKSIGRRSDQLIIDALVASGTSNTIAAGGTGFTYAKFQTMIRLFTAKSIFTGDDDIHVIINSVAQEDILNDDKFINTRYTADRLFDNGNTLNGMEIGGVTFHVFGDMAEVISNSTGRNVDDVLREIVSVNNLAPVSSNLIEMLNIRIIAHARAMERGHLITQFREFGIPMTALDDMAKMGQTATKRVGLAYGELVKSSDPALDKLLFDKDIQDIIDKTYAMSASDDSLQAFKRVFMNYTQWWKGIVTATPGFHLRNFFSNNATGVIRHGAKWMDPRSIRDATVAAVYALNPTKYMDIMTKNFNISEAAATAALNRTIGGKTLKQLAEIARETGVVSSRTYMTDVSKVLKPKVSIGRKIDP
ncbi:hypothetical protein LCGC14_2575090, partial [marine sediment metagenome]